MCGPRLEGRFSLTIISYIFFLSYIYRLAVFLPCCSLLSSALVSIRTIHEFVSAPGSPVTLPSWVDRDNDLRTPARRLGKASTVDQREREREPGRNNSASRRSLTHASYEQERRRWRWSLPATHRRGSSVPHPQRVSGRIQPRALHRRRRPLHHRHIQSLPRPTHPP